MVMNGMNVVNGARFPPFFGSRSLLSGSHHGLVSGYNKDLNTISYHVNHLGTFINPNQKKILGLENFLIEKNNKNLKQSGQSWTKLDLFGFIFVTLVLLSIAAMVSRLGIIWIS